MCWNAPTTMFSPEIRFLVPTKNIVKKRNSVALDLVGFRCDWMDICNVRAIYFIQHYFYVPCSDFFFTFSIIRPHRFTSLYMQYSTYEYVYRNPTFGNAFSLFHLINDTDAGFQET